VCSLGLDSFVFAYVMLVVWLCFQVHGNRGLHVQKRRNSTRKRRKRQVLNFQASRWRPSHSMTGWPSPASQAVITRDVQTVTPCDARHGFGRTSLPHVLKQFCPVSLPLSPSAVHDPEHVEEYSWPINRSKEERKRVGKSLESMRLTEAIFFCNLNS